MNFKNQNTRDNIKMPISIIIFLLQEMDWKDHLEANSIQAKKKDLILKKIERRMMSSEIRATFLFLWMVVVLYKYSNLHSETSKKT